MILKLTPRDTLILAKLPPRGKVNGNDPYSYSRELDHGKNALLKMENYPDTDRDCYSQRNFLRPSDLKIAGE